MSSQTKLLRQRRFLPLFITQFLGAFNDNVIKNSLVVLLIFNATAWTALPPEVLANVVSGVFILPFFLFSATAGELADKYDKAKLARLVKLLEICIVLVAGVGFALHSLLVLMASIFLLGVHSTFFGPIKYAILPQHLQENELVGGNALVEAGTFVAILGGTILGGLLAGGGPHSPWWIVGAGVLIAVAGYAASRQIPPAPPPDPGLRITRNPFIASIRGVAPAWANRTVFIAVQGISWFWLYGSLLLTQFPAYTKHILGGGTTAVTLLLAIFTLGIGLGSMACERLSAGKVEPGLAPLGALGLTLFGIDLVLASRGVASGPAPMGALAMLAIPTMWRVLADIILLGASGGLFIVPLYALVQQRSDPARRARVIAANNIVNAFYMAAGALGAAKLLLSGVSILTLFTGVALANALITGLICLAEPEFPKRFAVLARSWIERMTGR